MGFQSQIRSFQVGPTLRNNIRLKKSGLYSHVSGWLKLEEVTLDLVTLSLPCTSQAGFALVKNKFVDLFEVSDFKKKKVFSN